MVMHAIRERAEHTSDGGRIDKKALERFEDLYDKIHRTWKSQSDVRSFATLCLLQKKIKAETDTIQNDENEVIAVPNANSNMVDDLIDDSDADADFREQLQAYQRDKGLSSAIEDSSRSSNRDGMEAPSPNRNTGNNTPQDSGFINNNSFVQQQAVSSIKEKNIDSDNEQILPRHPRRPPLAKQQDNGIPQCTIRINTRSGPNGTTFTTTGTDLRSMQALPSNSTLSRLLCNTGLKVEGNPTTAWIRYSTPAMERSTMSSKSEPSNNNTDRHGDVWDEASFVDMIKFVTLKDYRFCEDGEQLQINVWQISMPPSISKKLSQGQSTTRNGGEEISKG
ncbi:hypothetical protein SBOR_2470 [Sclerotinia borealis F-4128]|uniref:Uncharacterized protein n=1 Tax=Sclerotinia borealis (strain F-4128) TaxID=1432307 RepID=W9CK25_SCLBF|nr:hypothetical protein SBOR_2470 [Sclerotinia borealis F-4128]